MEKEDIEVCKRVVEIMEHYHGKGRGNVIEFGRQIGIKYQNIQNWRDLKNSIKSKSRKIICEKCNISRQWLEEGTGNMFAVPPAAAQEPQSTNETTSDTITKLNAQITALKAEVENYKREAYIYQGQLAECRLHLEDVKKEIHRGLERQLSNSINSNTGIL